MRSKNIIRLAAISMLAITPGLVMAQNIGLRVGLAPAQTVAPTPQPPVVAVRSTFHGTPAGIVVVPGPQTVVPLVPNFPTVIISNTAPTVSPQNPFPGHHHTPPAVGTSRADVVRQFGQPSVTVITSTGETLYFSGNVTVIIQNGQVAGTK
jgi:hypothetical protein